MKTQQPAQQKNAEANLQQQKKLNKRPENKDNLDSREGEEQLNKGSDVTHNQKQKHSLTSSTAKK